MPISGAAICFLPAEQRRHPCPDEMRGRSGWSPCYAINCCGYAITDAGAGLAALFSPLSKHRQDFSIRLVGAGPALGLLALVGVQGDLTSLQPSREDCKRAALLWAVNRETGEVVVIPLASVVELNP